MESHEVSSAQLSENTMTFNENYIESPDFIRLNEKRAENDAQQVGNIWNVVPLHIDSGPRHFTPKNNTIYLIQEISTSSLIYFDGRNRQNYPTVYNWVSFSLVKFSSFLLFLSFPY